MRFCLLALQFTLLLFFESYNYPVEGLEEKRSHVRFDRASTRLVLAYSGWYGQFKFCEKNIIQVINKIIFKSILMKGEYFDFNFMLFKMVHFFK